MKIETISERFRINFNRLLNERPDVKQVDIARYVGVSSATVSEWRKGRKTPRLDKVKKIAEYFNVDMERLLPLGKQEVPEYSPDFLRLYTLYSQLREEERQKAFSYIEYLIYDETGKQILSKIEEKP